MSIEQQTERFLVVYTRMHTQCCTLLNHNSDTKSDYRQNLITFRLDEVEPFLKILAKSACNFLCSLIMPTNKKTDR